MMPVPVLRCLYPCFLALFLTLCTAVSAGERGERHEEDAPAPEIEYLMRADESVTWTVLRVTPARAGSTVRLQTSPSVGLPGRLARLAVFRNGRLLGFVRIRQSYSSGCTVGKIGTSMDPSRIKCGDVVRRFEISPREKTPPRKLRSREKKRIEKAVSNLGHDSYGIREKATEFLKSQNTEILPFVRRFLESPDPEVRIRANEIFDSISHRERTIEPDLARVLLRWTGWNKPAEQRGFLGISMSDVENGTRPGTLVVGIVEDTPAERIGLRADDVILSVDGEVLNDSIDLLEIISSRDPGARVRLIVRRQKEDLQIEVELTARPKEPAVIRR